MASPRIDLTLDPQIRNWVFLPIAIVTFLMGFVQQQLATIVKKPPAPVQQRVRDASTLRRLGALKQHGRLLPPNQFTARKLFFLEENDGFLMQKKQGKSMMSALMNPQALVAKAKDMMTSLLPQMVFGAWVRYMFGGFAVCRVPFPLSLRFRSMLQSGIEFTSRDLDVSYVSALSWYVLNLFGNQNLMRLLMMTPNTPPEEPDMSSSVYLSAAMNETMIMNWEKMMEQEKTALKAMSYKWALLDAEDELLKSSPYGTVDPTPSTTVPSSALSSTSTGGT